ncbi:MAG: tyrosine-type recombinase/integrase, partial [Candidatus Omnitrophica bacterium]|nr:tyrosine-type recombinase/integrase [Candidatus Omnitrophota bacterium]
HTYACKLAEEGVNPVAVQKLLGHSKIETTLIYYRLTDNEILSQGMKLNYENKSPVNHRFCSENGSDMSDK